MWQRGSLTLLLLFAIHAPAAELAGFALNTCGVKHCVKMRGERAWQSVFNSSYALARAELTIYSADGRRLLYRIQSRDVFYDTGSERIYLRNPVSGLQSESYYDLTTEDLFTFRKFGFYRVL